VQRNRLPYFIFNATVLVQRDHRHRLWPTAFEFTANDVGSSPAWIKVTHGKGRYHA
jgi:hypothetical protein